jgi:acyl transferase domain-containing protein/acyl carrier protein
MADLGTRLARLSADQRALLELRLAAAHGRQEPIAIVGMACRFPGAENLAAYWRLLAHGVDAISEVPAERWDAAALFDRDPRAPGRTTTRWGGFLPAADLFDAELFAISPREAEHMDPQQRLLLEIAWEALEDAGLVPSTLAGTATGVFAGIFMDDYRRLSLAARERADAYTGTGSTFCIAANRISYQLDLRGPSLAVDTACSSSLVAVHLACQSLATGESTLALAGGVNFLLTPEPTIEMSKAGLMAPDGRCKTFDARADGYVRGEGAGLLVLKPLARALADGDRIHAVVRGTAVNQDGHTNGLTSPNRFAQEAVLRAACRRAAVVPAQVQYVEAHGTGTALGDAMECEALGAVFGPGRPADRPLAVGSVKTNFGHLEAAAGAAGLIKVALALARRELPPSLHCREPNPDVPFADLGLAVQTRHAPWPATAGGPALAGVSSFGLGGTNAHAILEEAPRDSRPAAAAPPAAPPAGVAERPLHVLPLSAHSAAALRDLAHRHLRHLRDGGGAVPLADLCYSAATGRTAFEHRLAVVGDTHERMAAQLAAFAVGTAAADTAGPAAATAADGADGAAALPAAAEGPPLTGRAGRGERPRLAFLFSGQGAPAAGLGRELFATHPGFRATLLHCQEILAPHLERPLLDVLWSAPGTEGLLEDTLYAQPALFAVEVALAGLWREWGVVPDAVLGHSAGELAAACVAGVFSLEDGLLLTARRARLMAALPRDGAMAAVRAGRAVIEAAIAALGARGEDGNAAIGEDVVVAADNGPDDTVVSGRRAAVEELARLCREQGFGVRALAVSHAFHSPLVDPVLPALEAAAAAVPHALPELALACTASGALWPPGEGPDAAYWARHARQPTRFAAAMTALRAAGCRMFVEVGPGTTLLGMGARAWDDAGPAASWLPSLRPGEGDWQRLLRSAAALHVGGIDLDWRGFDAPYPRRRRDVPTYPFQRRRFWLAPIAPGRAVGATPAIEPPAFAAPATAAPAPPAGPRLLRAADLDRDPRLAGAVARLIAEHGLGAGSISQVTGKSHLFVGARQESCIYLSQAGASLAAMDFTGPESAYEPLLRDLLHLAAARGQELFLVEETADRLELLDRLGFSATRIGVWQDLADLAAFQLGGRAMRRLRYAVQHYEASGPCEVSEAAPGTEPAVDREIAALIASWAAARGIDARFAAHMHHLVFSGGCRHRVFLVRRGGHLEVAIFLLPSPALARRRPTGAAGAVTPVAAAGLAAAYLMDAECYLPDAPLGGLELGVSRIVEILRREGAAVLSLGLTLGTELGEHPGDDPEARALFAKLHQEGLLDGDGNFQFKSKFRPATGPAFLCRRRGAPAERLLDLVQLLANPFRDGDAAALAPLPEPPVAAGGPAASPGAAGTPPHSLLHRRLDLPIAGRVYESDLGVAAPPLLADHRLGGTAALPAAAVVTMVLAACRPPGAPGAPPAVEVADLTLHHLLALPDHGTRRVQLAVSPGGAAGVEHHAISALATGRDGGWLTVATAVTRPAGGAPACLDLAALRERCGAPRAAADFYAALAAAGYDYGPAFRAVESLWEGDGEVLGRLADPAASGAEPSGAPSLPLLDAAFHLAWPLVRQAQEAAGCPFVPAGLAGFRVFRPAPAACWAHCRLDPGSAETLPTVAIRLLDDAGEILAACDALRLAPAPFPISPPAEEEEEAEEGAAACLYEVAWRPAPRPLPAPPPAPAADALWLVLAGEDGTGGALAGRLAALGARAWTVRRSTRTALLSSGEWEVKPASAAGWAQLLAAAAAEAPRRPLHLVHLWGLDAAAGLPSSTADLAWLVGGLPPLVQALAAGSNAGTAGAADIASIAGTATAATGATAADAAEALDGRRADVAVAGGASDSPIEAARAVTLWIVTSGAQTPTHTAARRPAPAAPAPPAGDSMPVAVAQASLWGLGRVLAREHPELWGGLIDVAPAPPEEAAAAVLAEIRAAGRAAGIADPPAGAISAPPAPTAAAAPDNAVALAGGRRLVPRLVRHVPPAAAAPAARPWRPDPGRTHLVTGGLGALGLQVARRWVELGARHLALLGRHAPPPGGGAAAAVDGLRAAGAEVSVLTADAASRDELAAALGALAASFPPLGGIVHAAGVLDDGVLLRQTWARCAAVLAPKVLGALHLDALTRHLNLDYFVLFSSASALLGTPGQASYAAANALLAALAGERRRLGRPACCIAWGPWADAGMAAAVGERGRDLAARNGIDELPPATALAALEGALAEGLDDLLVLRLDAARLGASPLGREPLFAELAAVPPPATAAAPPGATSPRPPAPSAHPAAAPAGALRREILALAGPARLERLTAYLGGQVAAALHLDAAQLDLDHRTNRLGMDSLTVIELRNRLKADLGVDLPAVTLFDYPAVRQLAVLVAERLGDPPAGPAEPLSAAPPPAAAVAVDQLSDAEVEAMLRQLLNQEGR